MCSNIYNDVTDFEVCGFLPNKKKGKYPENRIFFLQMKKFIYRMLRTVMWQKKTVLYILTVVYRNLCI